MPMMDANPNAHPSGSVLTDEPILDGRTRLRLGLQPQALYEPVMDEVLDPRLAALMKQLERDQQQAQAG